MYQKLVCRSLIRMNVIMRGITVQVAIFLAALNFIGAIAFVLDPLIWNEGSFLHGRLALFFFFYSQPTSANKELMSG